MKVSRIDNTPTAFQPVVLSITLETADEVRALITARNKLGAPDLGTAWASDIREQWVSILNALGNQLDDDDAHYNGQD